MILGRSLLDLLSFRRALWIFLALGLGCWGWSWQELSSSSVSLAFFLMERGGAISSSVWVNYLKFPTIPPERDPALRPQRQNQYHHHTIYFTPSLHDRMFLPVPHALQVLLPLQRHSRTPMFLPQRIPHHRDRVHGGLLGLVLELDRNNPVVIVHILVWVDSTHRLVLLLDLFLRVEDQVQVLGPLQSHCLLGEVSTQHWQFFLRPGLVTSLEQLLILSGNLDRGFEAGSKVLDEDMLAEGRISVGQDNILIKLIGHFFELLGIVVDEASGSLLELPQAEWIQLSQYEPNTRCLMELLFIGYISINSNNSRPQLYYTIMKVLVYHMIFLVKTGLMGCCSIILPKSRATTPKLQFCLSPTLYSSMLEFVDRAKGLETTFPIRGICLTRTFLSRGVFMPETTMILASPTKYQYTFFLLSRSTCAHPCWRIFFTGSTTTLSFTILPFLSSSLTSSSSLYLIRIFSGLQQQMSRMLQSFGSSKAAYNLIPFPFTFRYTSTLPEYLELTIILCSSPLQWMDISVAKGTETSANYLIRPVLQSSFSSLLPSLRVSRESPPIAFTRLYELEMVVYLTSPVSGSKIQLTASCWVEAIIIYCWETGLPSSRSRQLLPTNLVTVSCWMCLWNCRSYLTMSSTLEGMPLVGWGTIFHTSNWLNLFTNKYQSTHQTSFSELQQILCHHYSVRVLPLIVWKHRSVVIPPVIRYAVY